MAEESLLLVVLKYCGASQKGSEGSKNLKCDKFVCTQRKQFLFNL